MKKLILIIFSIWLAIVVVKAQNEDIVNCYIPNSAGIMSALGGEPIFSIYINPNTTFFELPTAFNPDDGTENALLEQVTQLMLAQLPHYDFDFGDEDLTDVSEEEIKLAAFLLNIFDFDEENDVYIPSYKSIKLLLQFPDMTNMFGQGAGIYISANQRYMCTFEQLLLLDEDYSTRYYLSDIEPAQLLFLTPEGLETLNIPADEALHLKEVVQPWLPSQLNSYFDVNGCTQDVVEIYAVLPDLKKTIGTNAGYYKLIFVPDESNLPIELGGDGVKNGYYYLSDMELISVVPPLKYDGSWSWQGQEITLENDILAKLPSPNNEQGNYLIDVSSDLSAYIPGMTKGCYLLKFSEDKLLQSYSAILSRELSKTIGFPINNDITSIFDSETNKPLMDVLLILEDNIAKLYFNHSGNGINAYLADFNENTHNIFDYQQSFLSPITIDELNAKKAELHLDQYAPKIYLTGYGSDVYSGGTESEGLLFIKGGANDSLHIYMENFTVDRMQDTQWDMTFGSVNFILTTIDIDRMLYMRRNQHNNVFDLLGQGNGTPYTRGASSVLAFGSKSLDADTPFKICIHSKGENTLTGGAQSYFIPYSIDYINNNAVANCFVAAILNLDIDVLVNIFAKGMTRMVSSPISIRPYPYSQIEIAGEEINRFDEYISDFSTRLRFDDYWIKNIKGDTERTNGKLNLPIDYDTQKGKSEYDRSAPSIDYGSALGQVIFDGGQYTLTTAAKTTTALSTATHAIANRSVTFDINMKLLGSDKYPIDGHVVLPNTGTSIGRNEEKDANAILQNVIIENGTYNTYSAKEFKDYYDVVFNGLYYNYTDLRLPYNTQINGGSYNCDVYRVSDATQRGLPPIYAINSNDTLALCRQTKASDELPQNQTYIELVDVESKKGNTFSYRYNVDGVQADNDNNVHLYLPCSDQDVDISDVIIQHYTTLFPRLGIEGLMEVGGAVDVYTTYKGVSGPGAISMTNAYLMQYVPNMETINNARITIGGNDYSMSDVMPEATREEDRWAGTVRYSGTKNEQNSTPNENYTIQYGIYMMRSFIGNQWYFISPPFDVAKVYVVETTDLKYQGSSVIANLSDPAYIQYLNDQAASESTMLDAIFNQLMPDVTNPNNSGSGPLVDFISFLGNIEGINITELFHYNPDIEELIPGTNIKKHGSANANYFLYYNDGYNDWGDWEIKKSFEEYSDYWKLVDYTPLTQEMYINQNNEQLPSQEQRYLMGRGDVYAMYFPEGKDRYWDNKYIIFAGYGPQELYGTKIFSKDMDEGDADPDYILFQGNNTFANRTVSNYAEDVNTLVSTQHHIWHFDHDAQNIYSLSQVNYGDIIHSGEVYAIAEKVISNPQTMPQYNASTSDEEQLHVIENVKLLAWEQDGIMIQSFISQYVEVFSADGRTLWAGNLNTDEIKHINASAGVYIVHSENQSIKIVVKKPI